MNRSRFLRSRQCRAVGRRLQAYLDGEIDERRRGEIAAHLDACRACGLEFATYREVKESLSRDQPPVAVDALDRLRRFGDRLMAGIDDDGATPPADG